MENLTIVDPVEGGAVTGRPGSVVASGSWGSSSDSSPAATLTRAARPTFKRRRTPEPRTRTPRMREILLPGSEPTVMVLPEGFRFPPAGSGEPFRLPKGFALRAVHTPPCPPSPPSPPRETRPCKRPTVIVCPGGSRDEDFAELNAQRNQDLLRKASELEQEDEDLCDTEEDKVAFRAFKKKFAAFYRELASADNLPLLPEVAQPTDTLEERLTAEEMEMKADCSGWLLCPQARHFAILALESYNSTKKAHKFELGRVLLSKCFSEVDGTTFAHVNFTALPMQSPKTKRLFFAELMLIPDLQAYEGAEPMRVLHVCTIDDDLCFGGCHEIEREIKEPVRKNLDYDRCHACSDRIKHPRGAQFVAGHDRTRMQYVSARAWTYRK